jgi:hypothetical protein
VVWWIVMIVGFLALAALMIGTLLVLVLRERHRI